MRANTADASPRSSLALRLLRREPHIYSAMCRGLLSYGRFIAGRRERRLYQQAADLFQMNDVEAARCEDLRRNGFCVLPDFYAASLADGLFGKADLLFRELKIDKYDAYSVQNRNRASLEGLTYEELERTEKMIALKDPLLAIPECVPIAFDESILRIVTNFLGYVVPWYKTMIVRDFPLGRPRESSNFHKDNDEADSVQAFVYLVDIDEFRGPLVYVPASHRYDVRSCRPRLSRDLGISGFDGRISDAEVAKHYSRDSWVTLKVRRGSIAIIHGNGLHKGPCWARFGDPANRPRTAIRLDFLGHKMREANYWKANKIRREDYARFGPLQRLFTAEDSVV